MATGPWIIAGELMAGSGKALPITLALLGGIVVIGVAVTLTGEARASDASRLDEARRPTLADAAFPPS